MPVLKAGLEQRFAGSYSGIVDEYIKPAEFPHRGVDRSLPLGFDSGVVLDGDGAAIPAPDLVRDVLRALPIDVCRNNMRALTRQRQRGGAPNARCGSGDQGDLVGDARQCSTHCKAAIDHKDGAVDIASVFRGQEGDQRRHFLRRAVSQGRDHRAKLRAHLVRLSRRKPVFERRHHAGCDRSGIDGVHPDSPAAPVRRFGSVR